MTFDLPARPRRLLAVAALLILAPLAGCSSDGDGGTGPDDPGELAPLVGTWEAVRMEVTSVDDPQTGGDLVKQGANFTLEVRADGSYTATLSFFGQTDVEEGRLSVEGSRLTFDPDDAPARGGRWFLEDGTLVIDGETSFDFNFDGTDESADLHLELVRA